MGPVHGACFHFGLLTRQDDSVKEDFPCKEDHTSQPFAYLLSHFRIL